MGSCYYVAPEVASPSHALLQPLHAHQIGGMLICYIELLRKHGATSVSAAALEDNATYEQDHCRLAHLCLMRSRP